MRIEAGGGQEAKSPHRTTTTKIPASVRQRALLTPSQRTRSKKVCSWLWSIDSHAAPGEEHGEAGYPPATHGEAHVRVGTYSLKDIAVHKETMPELDYPKGP